MEEAATTARNLFENSQKSEVLHGGITFLKALILALHSGSQYKRVLNIFYMRWHLSSS